MISDESLPNFISLTKCNVKLIFGLFEILNCNSLVETLLCVKYIHKLSSSVPPFFSETVTTILISAVKMAAP